MTISDTVRAINYLVDNLIESILYHKRWGMNDLSNQQICKAILGLKKLEKACIDLLAKDREQVALFIEYLKYLHDNPTKRCDADIDILRGAFLFIKPDTTLELKSKEGPYMFGRNHHNGHLLKFADQEYGLPYRD